MSGVCVCVCVCMHMLHCVRKFSVACQVSLPTRFSRQEYWSGSPYPTLGDLLETGIKPMFLASPALAGRFLALCHLGSLSFMSKGKLKIAEHTVSRKKNKDECFVLLNISKCYIYICIYIHTHIYPHTNIHIVFSSC